MTKNIIIRSIVFLCPLAGRLLKLRLQLILLLLPLHSPDIPIKGCKTCFPCVMIVLHHYLLMIIIESVFRVELRLRFLKDVKILGQARTILALFIA